MAWMNPQTPQALGIPNPVADVAPLSRSYATPTPKIPDVTSKNIDELLGKSIAEKSDLQSAQERHKAEQALTGAQETSKLTSEIAQKQRALLESPELKEAKEAQAKPFVPTKETAGDLGLLFTLTNLVGFAIGGRAKGNAQAAMSAMNGMLEGHQKGRDDLYKREKDIYDENMKQLDKRVNSLYKDIDVGVKLLATDREAGMAKINEALARDDAKFVRDMANKFGYAKMYDVLKATKEQMDKATKLRAEENDRAERIAETARHNREMEAHGREMARLSGERLENVKEKRLKTEDAKVVLPMTQAIRGIEDLQQRLRDPEIQAGLLAKASPLLEKLSSLGGSDFETAVNQTLTGTDKTTLFLKDALLEAYTIERAAKGNQRLTVQDMKTVGPVLDPTNYKPETYNALLDNRRRDLYNNLQDLGYSPEEIKSRSMPHAYTPYGQQPDSKQFTNQQSQGRAPYTLNQVIEIKGKKYKVTGLSNPNDPDLEEIK